MMVRKPIYNLKFLQAEVPSCPDFPAASSASVGIPPYAYCDVLQCVVSHSNWDWCICRLLCVWLYSGQDFDK